MEPTAASDRATLGGAQTEHSAESGLDATDSYPFLLGPSPPGEIGSLPGGLRPRVSTEASKSVRLLDVTVAGLMLVLTLPLISVCIIAVLLSGPGPLLYRQTRIGRNGREFTCLKFRTMVEHAEHSIDQVLNQSSCSKEEWATLYKLRADPRVTSVGRLMRRYSVDELPQLFNVLKGEMSIVGPRPIVANEVHRYGAHFTDYCSVNPGLTGLWQVSGRHALSYDERVRLDADYANAKSWRLDLLILWKTVPVILFGENE